MVSSSFEMLGDDKPQAIAEVPFDFAQGRLSLRSG
jgi:hypothetical protein